MTLDELESLLDGGSAADLFGNDEEEIKVNFRHYSKMCHPDAHPGDQRAQDLFVRVRRLYEQALKPPPPIKSKKHEYRLGPILSRGDVADVYRAKDDGLDPCVLKVGRIPQANAMLASEAEVLNLLAGAAKGDLAIFDKYLPEIQESFVIRDQKKAERRINVFAYRPKLFTLEQVKFRHPLLDGRHIAWIFNRMLEILGYVHSQGYVHGAITPGHVLVDPETHGAVIVGWGHADKNGSDITSVPGKYKDLYPLEELTKKKRCPETDICLAAAASMWLGRGRMLPTPMYRFFQSCTLAQASMRPGDAWALQDEFRDLLQVLYGPPRFVELLM